MPITLRGAVHGTTTDIYIYIYIYIQGHTYIHVRTYIHMYTYILGYVRIMQATQSIDNKQPGPMAFNVALIL